MKKAAILSVFLIVFLVNPAFGFAGMTADNSTPEQELINATESDADIVLQQYLIIIDDVQLRSQNKLFITEQLVFNNKGTENFSGLLRTWLPDGAEEIRVGKLEMMMEAQVRTLEAAQNGNIISWADFITANNPVPPIYLVEYMLPAEPKGTITETKQYSKVFLYPTLTKQPAIVVLKFVKNNGESVTFTDEKGSTVAASPEPDDPDKYIWEMPQFKELNIEISKPALTLAGILSYLILGLVIILVLSYPVIRKKSGKLQALEEKIRASLKREGTEEVEEEAAEEAFEEAAEETVPEPEAGEAAPAEEDAEFEGKTPEELESLKTEALSKLDELGKEYESGNLMDEEYEELRSSYNAKVEKINKKLQP